MNPSIREFNAVDGYFALVLDSKGNLFAKVYTKENAKILLSMLQQIEQVTA